MDNYYHLINGKQDDAVDIKGHMKFLEPFTTNGSLLIRQEQFLKELIMVCRRSFSLAFITIVFLAACTPYSSPVVNTSTGTSIIPSATSLSPTHTSTIVIPTKTPIPPTLSATSISTPTTPPFTKTPRPLLSGSGGGVLSFVRTRESGWGIYIMNADGSGQRRILYHDQALAYPEWSPDGSNILFHKHQREEIVSINVMDADGGNERRLTQAESYDAAPFWSPDGNRIVFSRDEDIWVMNADGSEQSLLMDDPVAANGAEWSPDGSQILFESGRHGNTEIYVMDSDGTNLKRLTNNETEDWWPTWSPDGSQIAFMSILDRDWEIFVMNANGGNLRQLTKNEFDDRGPAWSPDGTRIAFVSNRDTGLQNDTEIYVMNADGSDQQRITEKSGFEWGVDWLAVNTVESPVEESGSYTTTTNIRDLQLTIIYDNTAFDNRLTSEWGFGVLVEYDGHKVIFDTGGSDTFMENMHILGIDPKIIEAVILSHEHGDHTGGLASFLSEANQPVVYLPEAFSQSFKRMVSNLTEVIEVSSSIEIFPGIYSTGQMYGGEVYEQGLAIDLGNEIVVITGCAHPGIVRMVRYGRRAVQPGEDANYKPIALVIGGFHLGSMRREPVEAIIEDLLDLGVKQISPTHCTGVLAISVFAETFGDDFVPGGAGQVISLP